MFWLEHGLQVQVQLLRGTYALVSCAFSLARPSPLSRLITSTTPSPEIVLLVIGASRRTRRP